MDSPSGPIINGQLRAGADTFPVSNSLNGDTIYHCVSATLRDCDDAITTAHQAYKQWAATTAAVKRGVMLRAADILEGKISLVQQVMAQEVNSGKTWSSFNVLQGAALLREAAGLVTHVKGEIVPAARPGTQILILREAAGVVFSIAPWNAPIILSLRAIAVPLICGNSIVFKPSEFTPKSQQIVVDCLLEAGLPAGVISFLPMATRDAPALTEYVIGRKEVRRINFTGSDRVGRIIATHAASHLKPCLLELGGNAPVVILKDADLTEAAKSVCFGAMANAGQICMSTGRVIIDDSVADEFVALLVQEVEKLKVGNAALTEGIQVSGLFTEASAQRVVDLVNDASLKSARLVIGDGTRQGALVKPHILDRVDPSMNIYHSEVFGPVVSVTRVSSESEAVEAANDSEYSLCASVYTSDIWHGVELARQIRAGSTHVNGPTLYAEPTLANGGLGGASGYGRFGGIHGIDEFVDKKNLTISSQLQFAL